MLSQGVASWQRSSQRQAARSRLLLVSSSAHHIAMGESLEGKTGSGGAGQEGMLPASSDQHLNAFFVPGTLHLSLIQIFLR